MTRTHRFAALHGAIMNIECVIPAHLENDAAVRMAYRVGHRDARHAAAELAAAQDALVDELVTALRCSVAAFEGDHIDEIESEYGLATAQRICMARDALAKWDQS